MDLFHDLWDRPLTDTDADRFYGVIGKLYDAQGKVVQIYPVAKGNIHACRRFIAMRIRDGVDRKMFGLRRAVSFPPKSRRPLVDGWRNAPILPRIESDPWLHSINNNTFDAVMELDGCVFMDPQRDEHCNPRAHGCLLHFQRVMSWLEADPVFDRMSWARWIAAHLQSTFPPYALMAFQAEQTLSKHWHDAPLTEAHRNV